MVGSLRGRMRHWGELAISNPVAFSATFTLGAFLAFTYSYVPLHTVKDRKLVTFEQALLGQEATIASLEKEIEGARVAASQSSQVEALAKLESERDKARRDADSSRSELKTAQKLAKKLERERADWKGRVAKLEKQLAKPRTLQIANTPSTPNAADEPAPDSAQPGEAEDQATAQPTAPSRVVAGRTPPSDPTDPEAQLPAGAVPASPAP